MLLSMLALQFVFILAILGVVGNMHSNGVWEKTCPGGTPAPSSCPAVEALWSYTTPEDWEGTCKTGTSQSPIDIITANAVSGAVADDYTAINVNSFQTSTVGGEFLKKAFLMWKDNSIAVSDIWTYVTWGGRDWKFQHLKLHFPAEHKMNGKAFEVEVALEYVDVNGKLMIMSFLGDRANNIAGDSPLFIADIADLAAADMGTKVMVLDFDQAIVGLRTKCIESEDSTDCQSNRESAYYGYTGSLSVPPCTEGVERLIFKEPFKIRNEDFDDLTKLTNGNSRPIQNLNSREIKVVE